MTILERSANGLRSQAPEMSAYRTLSQGQATGLIGLLVISIVVLFLRPIPTLIGLNVVITALYVAAFAYKLQLAKQALRQPVLVSITDEEARAIPDRNLPIYTILVPVYREAEVIGRTIAAIKALEYPRERLDVKILVEADDSDTFAATVAANPGPHFHIVQIPIAHPRTKPKACNYGLSMSLGEIVTIFDAEDRPEPLQLRRVVAAFKRLDQSVACLQAQLSYYNPDQNLITRWFTVEYLTWFSMLLPTLAQDGGPVPLGGTSMHIKRAVLEAIGAWDPHNVTEDADLGIRLQRMGFRTAVLESITYEEANSDFVNWVKQRSRWYKGYLQTWLVHMRNPLRLWRELGTGPFLRFSLVVGATPLVALINPMFWLLTILWFAARLKLIEATFPAWVYYPALASLIFGNVMALYLNLIAIRMSRCPNLLGAVLLTPIYWLMMSTAAVKAILQLTIAPWKWEKTTHGLDEIPVAGVAQRRS